jgi:hypothetical protein
VKRFRTTSPVCWNLVAHPVGLSGVLQDQSAHQRVLTMVSQLNLTLLSLESDEGSTFQTKGVRTCRMY